MELKEHNPIQTLNVEYIQKLNVKFLLQDMYRIFTKMGKKISIFLLLCGIFGVVFSLRAHKVEYVANADIRISIKIPDSMSANNQDNYFLDINKALSSNSVVLPMIKSDLFLNDLKKQLNVDSIDANISMTSIGSSNIFNLQVISDDASYSMKVLEKSIDVFGNIGKYIIDTFEITDITSPEASEKEWSLLDLVTQTLKIVFVGIFLVLCFIAYYGLSRKTIHNSSEIKNALHQQYVGMIPYMRLLAKKRKEKISVERLFNEPIYGNTFQKIATKLLNTLDNKKNQVILVTSATHKEGVSNISIGLGIGLGLNDKTCVVVDGNFKHPNLYNFINIKDFVDRDVYLNNRTDINKIITKSSYQNLSFVFSKEEHDAESPMVNSKQMKQMIQELKKKYDYVVIDSDSMILNADAEAYVQESDFTCMVIRPGISKAISIMDSINSLNRCSYKNQQIGCLINCVDKNSVY